MTALRSGVEAGFGLVARAIETAAPQTQHAEIMDALANLQCSANVNFILSVVTLALLVFHHGLTRWDVERVARQVAATLNLPDRDLEQAVQYCVQNATLAEALSAGVQEGTAQASTSAPTSESGKSGGKKGKA